MLKLIRWFLGIEEKKHNEKLRNFAKFLQTGTKQKSSFRMIDLTGWRK